MCSNEDPVQLKQNRIKQILKKKGMGANSHTSNTVLEILARAIWQTKVSMSESKKEIKLLLLEYDMILSIESCENPQKNC